MTIKELAGEVGVDDRTIRRDLNTLRKANFPLEERVTAHGLKHWKIVDGGANVPIHFNWSEAVAIYLGRRLLDPLAGTNFWQSAQSAFSKIRAMLGEAALAQLSKVEKTFLQTMPGVSDYSEKAELIDLLMLAIEDHKIAWVAYQSERATEPVSLELYPYGIVYHKGSLYLVAHSRDHETRRGLTTRKPTSDSVVDDVASVEPNEENATTRQQQSYSEPVNDAHEPAVPDGPERIRGLTPPGSPEQRIYQRAKDTPILNPSSDAHEPAVPGDAHEPAVPGDAREPAVPAAAIRHFKIDRVTGVEVQNFQFSPDPNFDLEKHFANSFGIYQSDDQHSPPKKIRIRFRSEVARYVQEKTWHPSQKLTKEKDGSVVLEVTLNDTHEIKAWTLSFGPKATVLEPESLRDEIMSDVEQLLKTYQTTNSRSFS